MYTLQYNQAYEQRENDLNQIIADEKLKPDETRKFIENAFREGEVKTVGTDIDKIMPPVSRFGGGNRAKKKQTIIDKLKAFFDKYFGIGNRIFEAKPSDIDNGIVYNISDYGNQLSLVAEERGSYGSKDEKE